MMEEEEAIKERVVIEKSKKRLEDCQDLSLITNDS